MTKRALIIAVLVIAIIGGGSYMYVANVVYNKPENCNICHFITPFYKQWQSSTHNMVPCLKCHDYSPIRGLAGQFMYLAGYYNPRPLTMVPDKNCLQAGCHDKRLIESKEVFTRWNIPFDHKPHFTEMRRGIKLHCRSCHSDIVQGEHVKVSKNVCFLCHFKVAGPAQAVSGCPSCHSAPKEAITFKGKTFSHEAAMKAGLPCARCHVEVTRGDGVTPKEKCYFCHVERTEMYSDVKFVHEKHVTEKQVDCLWCHPRIEHGAIRMADDIPMLK